MTEEIVPVVEPEPTTILLPFTGEVIERTDLPAVSKALSEIRDLEQALKQAKRWLTDALIEESERVGGRTFHFGDLKVELTSDHETSWDVTELIKLRDAGLPEERYDQLVTEITTYKIDGRVAKSIASANAAYAEIIERAKVKTPKTVYANVSR